MRLGTLGQLAFVGLAPRIGRGNGRGPYLRDWNVDQREAVEDFRSGLAQLAAAWGYGAAIIERWSLVKISVPPEGTGNRELKYWQSCVRWVACSARGMLRVDLW